MRNSRDPTHPLQDRPQRSPVYRQLIRSRDEPRDGENGLIDLSLVPRLGLRGPRVTRWLQDSGYPLPPAVNQAIAGHEDQWVLRLGKSEHWLLGDPLQPEKSLPAIGQSLAGCHSVYCEHSRAWFALRGPARAEIMAKLCGVDLRESAFPSGAIAQTSVARSNCIVLHHAMGNLPLFSIFCDSAAAEYLWLAVVDAMTEFDGEIQTRLALF